MIAFIQIALSVAIVTLILLQQRSAGITGFLGGDSSGFYQTRRGMEKMSFYGTIILSAIFVALALYQLAKG